MHLRGEQITQLARTVSIGIGSDPTSANSIFEYSTSYFGNFEVLGLLLSSTVGFSASLFQVTVLLLEDYSRRSSYSSSLHSVEAIIADFVLCFGCGYPLPGNCESLYVEVYSACRMRVCLTFYLCSSDWIAFNAFWRMIRLKLESELRVP